MPGPAAQGSPTEGMDTDQASCPQSGARKGGARTQTDQAAFRVPSPSVTTAFQVAPYPFDREDIEVVRSPCCWHCTEPIGHKGRWPIPFDYDDVSCKFLTFGCVCSFECAKGYIVDQALPRSTYMLLLVDKFTNHVQWQGDKPPRIGIAPPRTMLTKFGGTLSTEQFRSLATSSTVPYSYNLHRCMQGVSQHLTHHSPSQTHTDAELNLTQHTLELTSRNAHTEEKATSMFTAFVQDMTQTHSGSKGIVYRFGDASNFGRNLQKRQSERKSHSGQKRTLNGIFRTARASN